MSAGGEAVLFINTIKQAICNCIWLENGGGRMGVSLHHQTSNIDQIWMAMFMQCSQVISI